MTDARLRTGRRAEELVARRLAAAGWGIVERNARTRYGELDIVALDGRALVFVEVKAGRAGAAFGPERPVLAVDRRKQRQRPPPRRRLDGRAPRRRPATPGSASTPSASPSTAPAASLDVEHIEDAF